MKKYLLLVVIFSAFIFTADAQLKVKTVCPEFYIDILDGKVNGLKANAMIYDVKNKFPCFTSTEDETNTARCGGGVYYKDKDIYFYTGRDYIEIGPKFKGKMSVPLLGSKRNSLFSKLGNPVMKDATWDAYQTSYGTLVLRYDAAGKVKLIQFSTLGTNMLNLCE
ncbi:MAG TPA: hypothetical protein VGD17_07925 [Chitinophagaceae bacterium]